MRNHYLSKIAPLQKESASPFYSLTGHSWYAPYGAQWGADMIGLETGENIIAMQAQIAFYAGLHDRTICRSISSLRSSLAVQFQFSKRGKTNTRPINWTKPKFWRPSPRAEVPSLTVGIRPPYCHACGTWIGCREGHRLPGELSGQLL